MTAPNFLGLHGPSRDQFPASLGAQLSAASLSIVFASDATLPITLSNDTNYGVVGAATLRTAAQIGNATGAASFGAGATGAQVLRVVLPTDQTSIPAAQSGTWTVQPGNTANTTAWKVDGSAVTQPISAAALPLPTGAATLAKQPALGVAGTASADVITVQGIASMTALKVDGSGVTQPVSGTVTANAGSGTFAISAAALPLPSGAATLAKQPALGTAGSASADVISVQGIASMTALKVDGSAVTQPVSGTVTANAGSGTMAVSLATVNAAAGRSSSLLYRNDYSSVNVTTSAYVQVRAASGSAINRLYVFDSSGSAMIIATGAAASEVDQLYIPPGGSGVPLEISIPASTRIAIKALDVNAASGQVIITGLA